MFKRVGELKLAKIDERLLRKLFESSNYEAFESYYKLLLP